jgi:hypothetical protein
MDELKSRLTEVLKDISAKSPLAEAIRYTLGHWNGLTMFLTDGRVEVDTNTVEKLIVQWQRRWCRELGDFGFGTQHGKTQRARSADLSLRRARAHRLGSHQEPSALRAIGLELEGGP